jgi:hypothetical protein
VETLPFHHSPSVKQLPDHPPSGVVEQIKSEFIHVQLVMMTSDATQSKDRSAFYAPLSTDEAPNSGRNDRIN